MTNPAVGILFSWLLGVELRSLIFSNHFDSSRWPLLKALIFALFQIFDYQLLIFCHDLHLLYVHFREYVIQNAFVSLWFAIIIASSLQETAMIFPHDNIYTCHNDYSKRHTYQIHHWVWLTFYVWEFRRKLNQKL